MAATHVDATRRSAPTGPFGIDCAGSLLRTNEPSSGTCQSRLASLCIYIAAIAAFAFLSTAAAAQSDHRIPWLRGIKAITVSVNVFVDGIGVGSTSPCQLDRTVLERHGAETLRGGGLDAIALADSFAKLRGLQSEFFGALRDWEKAPLNAKPPGLSGPSERVTREGNFLAFQPTLYLQVGVATLGGGLCAVGITTELRAFPREKPVINYNGEQVPAALALWGAPPLALVVPSSALDHSFAEQLDNQVNVFITAWRTANGH